MVSVPGGKNRATVGVLVITLMGVSLLTSPGAVSAAHEAQLIFDPTVSGSGENVVYTLLVTNTGDPVKRVEITAPSGFEDFQEVGTPGGWACDISGTTLTYMADENTGISSGESAEFEFQAKTPSLGAAAETTENWIITTTDNAGYTENHAVAVKVDNLPPTLSGTTGPSPAPAGNVWLIITASEKMERLDNVYLAVENSLVENAEQREHWERLIRIQGPIFMSTTDQVSWKGVITIAENLEDNSPRILVLPEATRDLAGNRMGEVFTQLIEVDTRPPLLTQVSTLPSETNEPRLKLSGVVQDFVGETPTAMGGLSVRVNTNYDFLVTTSAPDGSFEVEVELVELSNLIGVSVMDGAGNMSEENLQQVVLDNTPPEIRDFRLVKEGVVIATENNSRIEEARPEMWVGVYDYWMGVKTVGMALTAEDGSQVGLSIEFENNLLRGVLERDLTPGTYTLTVSATDGLTASLNHSSSWWVFSYGAEPAPVEEEPSPAALEEVVLPPPEELPLWGFPPPPENIEAESAVACQEFSVSFGPYPLVVSEVEMILSENRENVRLRVDSFENLPLGVPEPENLVVYSYFKLSTTVPENIVQSTRLVFTVEERWIEQNIAENSLTLYCYQGGDLWTPLDVLETRENKTHRFYSTHPAVLSIFAVGGRAPPAEPAPLEEEIAPVVGGAPISPSVVAGAAVILGIVVGLILVTRKWGWG